MSDLEIDGYQIDGNPIGSGCCGEVFRAIGQADQKGYAVKRYQSISVDRKLMEKIFNRYFRMPGHPGIIPLREFQFVNTPYFSVAEFELGKPLYDCGFFDEAEAWRLITDLAESMSHAHKYGVIHGNLHPGNLFLFQRRDEAPNLRVGDFATGMVGDVHHMDLGETAYFAAPEQLHCLGSSFDDGNAERWDVYRFGAVAFWLLNRMLPRARGYRKARAQDIANSGGRPVPIDPFLLANSALDEGKLSWGRGVAKGAREKRYRAVVESCLSLNPEKRPVDMREVHDAFQGIDEEFFFNETVEKADAALHDAECRVTREKLKQKAKLFSARASATILAASFFIATFYLVTYFQESKESNSRIIELDQLVANQKARISIMGDQMEDTAGDLRQSREAADASFYNMAQRVDGGQAELTLLKELEQLRTYYLEILKEVASRPKADAERGRALHSLAHIEKRLSRDDESVDHFRKAQETFEALLETDEYQANEKYRHDMIMRLADCHENIGMLHDQPGSEKALDELSRAVWYFKQVLLGSPDDTGAATRLAECSYRLGQTLGRQNRHDEAIGAYAEAAKRSVRIRETCEDQKKMRYLDEMIAKLQFNVAVSLQKVGRNDEASDAYIATIESIERLRGIEGYSRDETMMMARSFLSLGDLFADSSTIDLADKDQVYNEALRLIAPLNREMPENVEVAALMCHALTRLAQLELEANHPRDGYNLSVRGIELLVKALGKNEGDLQGHIELAEARLGHLRFTSGSSARRTSLRGVESAAQAHAIFVEAATGMSVPEREIVADRLRNLFSSYRDACLRLGQDKTAAECSDYASFKLTLKE